MAADCNISLSEISIAEKHCQICALLHRIIRAVQRRCNDDELNVQIVREGSALKIGSEGRRILRLCSDPGLNLQYTCAVQGCY
jgi:CTP-dependent riboflavin kinase